MRKDIKLAMKSKMRSALSDSSNPNTLTKKFWSYVKNASNSTRMPDSICRNGIYANEPSKQAELFNSYFYDQFSSISNYSTDVDFSNDLFANFRFEESKIKDILLGIDTNKSSGPDEISGIVLKSCALTLARPLSILFNLSYSMGKLTNLVMKHFIQFIFSYGHSLLV